MSTSPIPEHIFDENVADESIQGSYSEARFFGDSPEALSISGDVLTVAVGAPGTDDYECYVESCYFTRSVGAVQIFKHMDAFDTPPPEADGLTWIPVNEIRGEIEDHRLGKSVALTDDGSCFFVTRRGIWVEIFDVDTEYCNSGCAESTIYSYGYERDDYDGGQVAFSRDAEFVAVSAVTHQSRTGQVDVFRKDVGSYRHVNTFNGEEEYDDFGRAIALSSDNPPVLVVGSRQGITTCRYSDENDAFEQYGNVFGTPTQQRECCFDKDSWGDSVAVSADGSRVVGGNENRKAEFEGLSSPGDVGVWDLHEQ